MERKVGTISRGIRCPIIREGDNLAELVTNSVLEAAEIEGFELRDRDVISITESIVARAQGNYASVEAIAEDVKAKLGGETVGVITPILSRNRFAICLKGIAMGAKKVVLMLSYPSDEVGNALLTYDQLDDAGINPYSDVLTLERYRELFGENKHEFTGVDYVQYYSDLIKAEGAEVEVVLDCGARVDCVTEEYAVEFDFANKWAECIGQALYYGIKTNKQPVCAIIIEQPKDKRYIKRLKTMCNLKIVQLEDVQLMEKNLNDTLIQKTLDRER